LLPRTLKRNFISVFDTGTKFRVREREKERECEDVKMRRWEDDEDVKM
jgi:hypothetical protein